jgi:transcriptional regulator with XRE-family HTH domain
VDRHRTVNTTIADPDSERMALDSTLCRVKETTACSRDLGYELRRRRELVGLSVVELADRLGWGHSKLSRLETGLRGAAETDVVQYLAQLGHTFQEMRPLRALCRESARDLGYWLASPRSLDFHESRAECCVSYHPETIPAPLLVGDESAQRPNPSRLYLLHEDMLRAGMVLEQALKLLLLADLPHVAIQVVPGGHAFGGAFRLLEFPTHSPLVYVSGHDIGLILEEPGYVAGYQALADQITDAALDTGQTRDLLVELAAYAQVS